jgi:hypothetical protein
MREKRIADSRFQPIVDYYCQESQRRYGAYQWDGTDGRALGRLLLNQPQVDLEGWSRLLLTAFEWAEGAEWSPLSRGFRFREFGAHFVKIVVRMKRGPRPAVSRAKVIDIVSRFRSQACCISAERRDGWWDDLFQRHLGITLQEADAIMQPPIQGEKYADRIG